MTTERPDTTNPILARKAVAEGLGTLLLVAAVVGSGIMGERLSGGNIAIALLANTIATGAALAALILTFGSVSGAHFNPAVTMTARPPAREALAYISAQVAGGILGAMLANAMFAERLLALSTHARGGVRLMLSEFVATFGLVTVIAACPRHRAHAPYAVAAYITAAYWFTSSTSFANPAVTIARACSDTFAGIRPLDVPGFVIAQLLGAAVAAMLARWIFPPSDEVPEGGQVSDL